MKERRKPISIIYAVIAAMGILTCIMMRGSDWKDILLSLFFLAVMAALICLSDQKGLKEMRITAENCRDITGKILGFPAADKAGALWKKIQKDSGMDFHDPVLCSAWKEYRKKETPGNSEEYITEELVYERCSKSLCDMVPGILTALGILGTFIGLIISMNAFTFGSAGEMGNVLESIVGGIHVAFYTSVYGVCLSIIYNLLYRNQLGFLNDALYRFHESLRECNQKAESADYGEEVIDRLTEGKQIVEQIAHILENEMPEKVGKVVGETIRPSLEDINKSLKRVIGDFREEQAASLQTIAGSFVEKMHQALDGHIIGLGKSVDRLSLSQEVMTGKLKGLLEEIEKTAKDTAEVNAQSYRILRKFEIYMERINAMVSEVNSTYSVVVSCAGEIRGTVAEQGRLLYALEQHERQFLEAGEGLQAMQKSYASQTEKSAAAAESMQKQQDAFMEGQSQILRGLADYSQKIFESMTELKSVQLSSTIAYQEYLKTFEANQKAQKEEWEKMYAFIKAQEENNIGSFMAQHTDKDSREKTGNEDGQTEAFIRQQANLNQMIYEYIKKTEEKKNNSLGARCKRLFRDAE